MTRDFTLTVHSCHMATMLSKAKIYAINYKIMKAFYFSVKSSHKFKK